MNRAHLRVVVAKALRGEGWPLAWDETSAVRRRPWLELADAALDAIEQERLMNRVIQRIHDIGAEAKLKTVRVLNRLALLLLGSVDIINHTYPIAITQAVAKLPPQYSFGALLLFCGVVEVSTRHAAKVNGG